MGSLCKYKNSLGKPGKGFHVHFLGIAIFDLLATILICVGIWKITGINFWLILLVIMILTIIIHRIFCVNTTLNKLIFGTI